MKRKRNNILKKEVKSAKYRQRIEKSKKQYSRKNSKDFVNLED
jgi:stalled ribosome alternative rescue factor ArfA